MTEQVDLPPEEFVCPITQDIMIHPVMDREGHSFETEAIYNWLLVNTKCPIGREKISHTELSPNRALKSLIEKWSTAHGGKANGMVNSEALLLQEARLKAQLEENDAKGIIPKFTAPPPSGPPPPTAFRGKPPAGRPPASAYRGPPNISRPPEAQTLVIPKDPGGIPPPILRAMPPNSQSLRATVVQSSIAANPKMIKQGNEIDRSMASSPPPTGLIRPPLPITSPPRRPTLNQKSLSSEGLVKAIPTPPTGSPRMKTPEPMIAQQNGIVKALYDYTAQQQRDLSFREGEFIRVLTQDSSGWWQGEINGQIGYFPSTFVEDQSKCFYVRALYDFVGEMGRDLSFKAGDRIRVVDNSNPSGWWKGEVSATGTTGFFPCNFVEFDSIS